MTERKYVDGKFMRYGYTTGSCAAAAAKAATLFLLCGAPPRTILLSTPKGKVLNLLVEKAEVLYREGIEDGFVSILRKCPENNLGEVFGDGSVHIRKDGVQLCARCAIRKDAGDDPDVTHGTLIFSEVRISTVTDSGCSDDSSSEDMSQNSSSDISDDFNDHSRNPLDGFDELHRIVIHIDGGEGIGRVTKPGLDQPVGAAAINSGPRAMIRAAVAEAISDVFLGVQKEDRFSDCSLCETSSDSSVSEFRSDTEFPTAHEAGTKSESAMKSVFGAELEAVVKTESGAVCKIPENMQKRVCVQKTSPGDGVLLSVLRHALSEGRLKVEVIVSAPEGELLGKRTFNPMMGIEGGISILGTTGIVEPMSDQALAATIETEVSVIAAAGHKKLMINLGNYGENFTTKFLGLGTEPSVKCANFIGVAVDAAVAEGLDQILLIGHIGKLVKLGISMFNTHSNNGDGRLETLAACAVEAGLNIDIVRTLLTCATTEAAVDVLDEAGQLAPVLEKLKCRIEKSIERHIPDSVQMEFICFSGKIGQWRPLFQSKGAEEMSTLWK